MLVRTLRTTRLILGSLLIALPSAALNLSVDLNTDYVPQVDFDLAVVEVRELGSGVLIAESEQVLFVGNAIPARIASIELAPGSYQVQAKLFAGSGALIASAVPLERSLSVDFGWTAVVGRPAARNVTKQASLVVDRDGDGQVSAADILRYDVWIPGPHDLARFEDQPDTGARLVAGSVTTTHGLIDVGNLSGDRDVAVDLGPLATGEQANISFDVVVTPEVLNQGLATVFMGNSYSEVLSDDPDTALLVDRTRTLIRGGAVDTCEDDLALVDEQLAIALADPDEDGIPDAADDCADSASNEVDDRGCTAEEFCAAIDIHHRFGWFDCARADWMSDESNSLFPADCFLRGGVCAPGRGA